VESGNLYDYPRETIERRKLVRQLRSSLQSGLIGDQAEDELYGSILDLEKQLSGFEEKSRMKSA